MASNKEVIVIDGKSVLENINDNYELLFTAEKKVAHYILNNAERAVTTNVSELADLSGASDATVIRMCKRIGYEGFYQMKIKLSHDLGKGSLVKLQSGNQRPENIKDIFQLIVSNLLDIEKKQNIELIMDCVNLIKNSKVVHIIASGNTIPVAMDMSFRLAKLGIRATNDIISEYSINNISLATSEDLVIAITHSGGSRYVIRALELAKEREIKTIVITESERSPAASVADFLLCATVTKPIFEEHEYGLTSQIYVMAIIDTILYFIAKGDTVQKNNDQVELLFSEFKV